MNENMMMPGPSGQPEYNFARVHEGYVTAVSTVYGEAAREYHKAKFPMDIECPSGVSPVTHHAKYGRVEQKQYPGTILRGNVLIDIPSPCVIVAEGIGYTVEEGVRELELNFEAPGKYSVRVTMNPAYFDKEFEIEKVD